jgi:Zn-dependent protease with chaperone function
MGRSLWWVLVGLAGVWHAPAWCQEDIIDVLRRSQEQRLQAQTPADADSDRVATVLRSFQSLLQALPTAPAVELRVTRGPLLAETLHGHIIVTHEDLADMPEPARLFILAHELGHVAQQHWLRTALLYQKWVPGAVTPELTDPVTAPLVREAAALAHEQEFAADAFAARLLQRLGHGDDELLAVFRHLGAVHDSATHPGTRKRIASLRALATSLTTPGTNVSTH